MKFNFKKIVLFTFAIVQTFEISAMDKRDKPQTQLELCLNNRVSKISGRKFGEYLGKMYKNVCAAHQIQEALIELAQSPAWKDKCKAIKRDNFNVRSFYFDYYNKVKYQPFISLIGTVLHLPFGQWYFHNFEIYGCTHKETLEQRDRFWTEFVKKIKASRNRLSLASIRETDEFNIYFTAKGESIPELPQLDFYPSQIQSLWYWMCEHYKKTKKKHS